ncbi:alanine--glyoxylate aminotransferase 2-like [Daktulosphaira vitifoliae]|uniref:alanine--glyoxylate aminotransferase 2-like n=1 Tax=Daktulosphaira vitifoliae TaxID=58002 RepID=UPI0021AB0676|nr:alanine--glyoxylate aminotransferase 2-like [Daktulosphaira vitifoliae]
MGNGHPVAAVITTEEIAHSFAATGIQYFNTYGGNPVSCAISIAVMDVIDEENLMENARVVGDYLLAEAKKLQELYPDMIGDVRGIGLFIGIELIGNSNTKAPATEEAKQLVNRMKDEEGILLSTDGPDANVIKLKPPMVFNIANANRFLKSFKKIILELRDQRMM